MTKTEEQTIRNIVARLKKPNCGCSNGFGSEELVQQANDRKIEAVSRIYLDTWVIPSLEMLLPGEQRDPDLAMRMSK